MAPERQSRVGTRIGSGDHHGVEAPWPLISMQKYAKNEYKPPEYIKTWGSTRVGEEEARRTGEKEARDLRSESPQDRKGTSSRSRPSGGGIGLIQCRRKVGINKLETKGFDRYVATLRAAKGGQTGDERSGRKGHTARGFRVLEGCW